MSLRRGIVVGETRQNIIGFARRLKSRNQPNKGDHVTSRSSRTCRSGMVRRSSSSSNGGSRNEESSTLITCRGRGSLFRDKARVGGLWRPSQHTVRSMAFASGGVQSRSPALSCCGQMRMSSSNSGAGSTAGGESAAAATAATEKHPEDAEVLRQTALYIEEDSELATSLAAKMSSGALDELRQAIKGVAFEVKDPSAQALRRVVIQNAVPFVAFGFMDNAIMIIAGEYIDLTLGVALGITTMAAAALGNLISDLAGVGLGGVVEDFARRLGLPDPQLSRAQLKLSTTRIAGHAGCAIGVAIGCLLGMCPLFFLPEPKVLGRKKQREQVVTLIDSVMREAGSLVQAKSVTLFVVDQAEGTLWHSNSGSHHYEGIKDLTLSFDSGALGHVATTGETVNQPPGEDGTESMLCMPVFGKHGKKVIGVVQAVGKRRNDDAALPHSTLSRSTTTPARLVPRGGGGAAGGVEGGFTGEDIEALAALNSHISTALETIRSAETAEYDLSEAVEQLQRDRTMAREQRDGDGGMNMSATKRWGQRQMTKLQPKKGGELQQQKRKKKREEEEEEEEEEKEGRAEEEAQQ